MNGRISVIWKVSPTARTNGDSGHRQAFGPRFASRAAFTSAISSPTVVSGWSASSSRKTPVSSSMIPSSSTRCSESRSRSVDSLAAASIQPRRRLDHCRLLAGQTGDDDRDRIDGTVQRCCRELGGCRRDGRAGRALEIFEAGEDVRLADLEGVGARQVVVRPHGRAADLLMCRQLRVRIPDDRLLVGGVVEQEHGMDPETSAERPTHDCGVLDPSVVLEDGLDVVRVDLLPVRQGEHVLLPTPEGQHAVLREGSEVARVVPALGVDRSGRRLGVLPVAGEPARAAGEDLAVLGDAHLHARDRFADGAEHVPARPREAHDGTHLRRTVALQDLHAHLRPAPRDVDVERGCPDADGVEVAAELCEHGPEQQAANKPRRTPCDRVKPFEHGATAGLIDLPLDRRRQEPQALRDDEEDGYPEVPEGPDQHGGLPADRVDDRGADRQWSHEAEYLLVEVRQRQDRQQAIADAERQDLGHRRGAGHEVPVAEHRALWLAGRAAREHDLGKRVAPDGRGRYGACSTRLIGQALDEEHRNAQLARRGLGLAARDDQASVGLGDDLASEIDRVADIEGYGHGTEVGDREERDPPLRPVHGPDDDAVALGDAVVPEDGCRFGNDRGEVAIAPCSGAEERPDQERRAAVEPLSSGAHQVDQRFHCAPPLPRRRRQAAPSRRGSPGLRGSPPRLPRARRSD
jgi:hypothetical protein